LLDAIRAVELRAGDGQKAIDEMIELGAEPLLFTSMERHDSDQYTRPPDQL